MREFQKYLPCPQCGEPALWAPDNPSRPFCSSRCKTIDLGAWASQSYRVPVQEINALPDDGGDA